MLQFIKENKAFTAIFVLGAIIRIIPIGQYQFSYDELCGLRNTTFSNWHDFIEQGVKLDTHPILVQLIINAIVKTIGYSEFWVKLPFILFSLAAMVYAYLFSVKWFGKNQALLAASIFSFSYIFLFYAPLARMYAGGLFFSTALVYYLFNLCFDESKKTKDYVWFAVFILLCALNNHLSCLFAFTCGIFGLCFQKKETFLTYVGACMAAVILYLPHLGITMAQLGQGGIGHEQNGWLAMPDRFVLFSLTKTLLGTGFVWLIFFAALVISIRTMKETPNRKILFLFILFLVNYGIIHWYSVYKAPIFQNSVMLFSAPCFIWALTGLINFKDKVAGALVGLISVALIGQSIFVKHFFENAVLNQNEFQYQKYIETEKKFGEGKVFGLFFGTQPYFVELYESKNNKKINNKQELGYDDLRSFIKDCKAEAIVLGDASWVQTEIVKENYPYLIEQKQSLNVNYRLFSKQNRNAINEMEVVLDSSGILKRYYYEWNYNKDKISMQGQAFTCNVDSSDEYPFSAKALIRNVAKREGNMILLKVKLQSNEILNDVGVNYSITNQKDSTLFFGGTEVRNMVPGSNASYVYTQVFMGSDFRKWRDEGCKITFFVWNRGKHKFTINDLQIKTIDYWPERWSWWE
jgi:4-amino-4-deoxy-L-arabinose transferase-like glycosyltransferase